MKKLMSLSILAAVFMAAPASFAGNAEAGAKLFKKCKMCHAVDRKKMGPSVKSMSQDEAFLKLTITEGRKRMPSFKKKFNEEEIDNLVAYLRSQQD